MSTDTADELLAKAKAAIASGERSLREAAELIAEAQERGSTQRGIAAKVGKSVGWVNTLLRWRATGYAGAAFGVAHHSERRRLVHPLNKAATEDGTEATEQVRTETTRTTDAKSDDDPFIDEYLRAEQAHQQQQERIRSEWADLHALFGVRRLSAYQIRNRRILVGALGMLGSDQPGIVQAAIHQLDEQRKILGMSWDDLIIPAAEPEQAAA